MTGLIGSAIGRYIYMKKMEEIFLKAHLKACEYLQTDPAVRYENRFLEERMDRVLSLWKESGDQKSAEELQKTFDMYLNMMGVKGEETQLMKNYEQMKIGPGNGPYAFQADVFYVNKKIPWTYTATIPELCVGRCRELIAENKLKLADGTISETYVKKELTQRNHDQYENYLKRPW